MYQPIPIRLFKPQELAHLRNTHPFLFRRRQPLVWAVCFHFLYQFFVFPGIHFSLLIHEAFLLLPIPYRTFSKKFRMSIFHPDRRLVGRFRQLIQPVIKAFFGNTVLSAIQLDPPELIFLQKVIYCRSADTKDLL